MDVAALDIAYELAEVISSKHNRRRFRRKYHCDSTIEYQLNLDEPVHIGPKAWATIISLFELSEQDNRERPFLMAMNEDTLYAEACFLDNPGSEGDCEHSTEHIMQTKQYADDRQLSVSFGHTHPVFYWQNETRTFGALPSNIFLPKEFWEEEMNKPENQHARSAFKEILDSKIYKRHPDDYICSLFATTRADWNPPGFGKASRFHWIITPRLRQVGVFEVKDGGVVVYHPWKLATGAADLDTEVSASGALPQLPTVSQVATDASASFWPSKSMVSAL
eukprot:TRINITY_DN47165_c0_g1_i1.p1 TRINITY_DN47165_c0_g1~~TRINITY_DN47165_c0_g1_i1.p1  ORF type:complete len:300 (+),score=45.97 TRINITY_DN47165_c0_g1_i1:67-900(+)